MKHTQFAFRINLILLFTTLICFSLVFSNKLKKKNNVKLDEVDKRNILIQLSQKYIFDDGEVPPRFNGCMDNKSGVKTFFDAEEKKELAKVVDGLGKQCYSENFTLKAEEREIQSMLNELRKQYVIQYSAIDGVASTHRGSIQSDFASMNHNGKKK